MLEDYSVGDVLNIDARDFIVILDDNGKKTLQIYDALDACPDTFEIKCFDQDFRTFISDFFEAYDANFPDISLSDNDKLEMGVCLWLKYCSTLK